MSAAKARQLGAKVKVLASVLTSDPWSERDLTFPDVSTLTRNAAKLAYEKAGVGPDDLDLVELHDCFATAELLHYENLGLCEDGRGRPLIDEGEVEWGGRIPVNVSGGLLSKGHPLGATGVANIYEVTHAPPRRRGRPPGGGREGRPRARHRPRLRLHDQRARRVAEACGADAAAARASRRSRGGRACGRGCGARGRAAGGGDALAAGGVEGAQDLIALGGLEREAAGARGVARGRSGACAGRCCGRMTLPVAATMARSMTFASSRTLPGHGARRGARAPAG